MGDGGGYGGHGSHGHGDRELVESSAQEGVGRVAAWERWRKVWRCSPSRELNQDGPGQEIDGGALLLGKNRGGGIRATRKTAYL